MRLIGIHAVQNALEAGRPIERVIVARGAANPRLQQIVDACRSQGVALRFEPREQLDRLAQKGVHQGVLAITGEQTYGELADVMRPEGEPAVLVLADGIEDPHNLGAVIRSAHAAGADAVVIPKRRSAGLTETVAKAAAGALEHLPIVRVANINRAIDELKQAGYWSYGLDERGDKTCYEADLRGRVALVLGAEGAGLHRLTAEKCDFLIRIPVTGKISSLNVSVAAGVVLFEALRQRSTP